MKFTKRFLLLLTLLIPLRPDPVVAAWNPSAPEAKLVLKESWYIQPSTQVNDSGDAISTVGFESRHWYSATMPSTVMAALAGDKVYADPYFGINLRSIPGENYPIGANFSNIPMPPDSAFRTPWWYRTEFTVPPGFQGRTVRLHFDGINFRANVWLNGHRVADAQQLAGAWRLFDFDVSSMAASGKRNALAVEVFPPTPHDLAITFVDWNPAPPDKGMGIWRDVYLTATGPISIEFPDVVTKLDLPSVTQAHLTITAELKNWTSRLVSGQLNGAIENVQFTEAVTLQPHETKVVTFRPDQFPQLTFANPRLWWPAQVGPQNLYDLNLRFETSGTVSDQKTTRFGIREVTSELDTPTHSVIPLSGDQHLQSHRLFKINGKNILIRGAGYSFDMLLRESPERAADDLTYVRDMNLNAIRLEGKIVDDNFLRLADEYGILITAGWCCCDHWEHWKDWDAEDRAIAAASLRDQIRRLRTHPSVFNWMNGSDNPPPSDVESMYVGILKQLNWPNPYESSATARPTSVTGETGVKMTGPYDYVPPSYWLLDHERGGAHGFNTETSPGPAVPPVESLRRMLPTDRLWPVNSWWDFHAGGGAFKNINVFEHALDARYGTASDLSDFAVKSQVAAYEGERAMFEAFGRNKYTATGVIQWMLNNAWPSIIWHLYDYYLRPGGGYFGTKKACEPLHVQYSYDDRSVVVVNSYYKNFDGLKVSAQVYNLNLEEKFTRHANVDIPSDGMKRVFTIPDLEGLSSTYFVRLSLEDSSGKPLSSNFYWLSTKPDTLDWDRSTWFYTPQTAYADLTGLEKLPKVELRVASTSDTNAQRAETHVTVENPSRNLAFFVHLKVLKTERDSEGDAPDRLAEILPVLWEDNYFPLMPGEKKQITATYAKTGEAKEPPVVEVDGWNVVPKSIHSTIP